MSKNTERYFEISGYWLPDNSQFDGNIVTDYDSFNEDNDFGFKEEDIFFYGLSEEDIQKSIKDGKDDSVFFVITDYKELINPKDIEILNARELLESKGFFVRNLWQIKDVTNLLEEGVTISDEEAMSILERAVKNPYTTMLINISIQEEVENLKKKKVK